MAAPFRYVAPAGAPIGLGDLARWAGAALRPGDPGAALGEAMAAGLGVTHVFLTSTGRAGLTVLLRAMRRLLPAERREVVLPSYTCYSVAASVVKAGLTPRIVDIAADTLDYADGALEAVDFSRVLAVVATNLYGLPNDLAALHAMTRARGVFLIDDAAQALGASVAGRPSGTWGDAGLYSFDKGKNVSAIDGGVVVCAADDLAGAMGQEMATLATPAATAAGIMVAKTLVYAALLRPWLYWIPNRVPQLKLGQTVFTTDFPLARPTRPERALAAAMFGHLETFTAARRANAAAILAQLPATARLTPIRPIAGSVPVYLRLPLLAADAASRDRLLDRLQAAGIGATGSYPRSIAEVEGYERASDQARVVVGPEIARRILTLPTHPFVSADDIRRMVEVIGAVATTPATGMAGAA